MASIILLVMFVSLSQFELLDESEEILVYVSFEEDDEIRGISMIWKLVDQIFWNRCDEIRPNDQAVATVVLDLPKFDKEPYCDVYGTISYEIDEKQYQTPLPVVRLAIQDIMDGSCQAKVLTEEDHAILAQAKDTASYIMPLILSLRSTSVEKTIDILIKQNPTREKQLLKLLKKKSFQEIYPDAYVASGYLMHCLVEIVRIIEEEGKLRISARSSQQMNIILQLLRDKFPDMIVKEDVNPLRAAMVLMEELKLYLRDASTAERQMARIRTDLLIP